MRNAIRGKCSKLTLALLMELKLTFSSRHNASYRLRDVYRVLLATCNRDGGASSIEGRYLRSKLSKDGTKLPSRSWVFGILKKSRHDHMLIRCKRMIKRSMLQARRRGMRKPVDVSVDMHDIPFYGKVMDAFYVVRSKGKKGTTRFNRLATLHCVVDGSRLTLGVEVVRMTRQPLYPSVGGTNSGSRLCSSVAVRSPAACGPHCRKIQDPLDRNRPECSTRTSDAGTGGQTRSATSWGHHNPRRGGRKPVRSEYFRIATLTTCANSFKYTHKTQERSHDIDCRKHACVFAQGGCTISMENIHRPSPLRQFARGGRVYG